MKLEYFEYYNQLEIRSFISIYLWIFGFECIFFYFYTIIFICILFWCRLFNYRMPIIVYFRKTFKLYSYVFFFLVFVTKKVVQRVNRRCNCQNNSLQITDKLYIVFHFAINYVIPDNRQQPTTNYLYLMIIKVFSPVFSIVSRSLIQYWCCRCWT